MAPAPLRHAFLSSLLGAFVPSVWAAVVTYDFNITWVNANPDGAFVRPTIGINGQWPIPQIEANIGDDIVVNVNNQLGNQSTSLHFHGLFMRGANHMDGPSQVTQCPIPPGGSFTYAFTIDQPGTYWYHSHTESQYPDGLRGPLVIHDPDSPFLGQYDEELVLTLSDWYHDQMATLIPEFMSKGNPTGAEPVPQAALMNEAQDTKISVQPGKTYLFRVINLGAFASQYVWLEGHSMTIVEIDGVYTKPYVTDMIYLSVAQRCSFLVTMKDDASSNYPVVGSMDTTLFDYLPDELNWNVTGWLVYDEAKPLPEPAEVGDFDPVDDLDLVPYDDMKLLPPPDRVVELDVVMDNLGDGSNYAFFNNITYQTPKVPSLYTALTAGDKATNPRVYGDYTQTFVLEQDEIVQIVLNNLDDGRHPFHMHGHHFQVVYRGEEDSGLFQDADVPESSLPQTPMRRDTIVVWPNGNIVLRFKASNPGVWLFHCHIEWHVASGLVATFVESPLELQKTLRLPKNHLDACATLKIPTAGNAAANDKDFLDLTGQNAQPDPLPAGFTTGGLVAMVVSSIMGVIGVVVIGWYGLNPVEESESKPPGVLAHLLEPEDTEVDLEGDVRDENTATTTGAQPTSR